MRKIATRQPVAAVRNECEKTSISNANIHSTPCPALLNRFESTARKEKTSLSEERKTPTHITTFIHVKSLIPIPHSPIPHTPIREQVQSQDFAFDDLTVPVGSFGGSPSDDTLSADQLRKHQSMD
jgi:hypothetical protein